MPYTEVRLLFEKPWVIRVQKKKPTSITISLDGSIKISADTKIKAEGFLEPYFNPCFLST